MINDDSIQLVKSYGSFLKDESEHKLNNSKQDLGNLKQELNEISTELKIKENIETILNEINIEDSDKTLLQFINSVISNLENSKMKLFSIINDKDSKEIKIKLPSTDIISQVLSRVIESIQGEIKKYTEDDADKKKKISILEKERNNLLENESINKQKESLKKWFELDSVENKLRQKAKKINTTKISNLSKTAHNDLLTETLKTNFLR